MWWWRIMSKNKLRHVAILHVYLTDGQKTEVDVNQIGFDATYLRMERKCLDLATKNFLDGYHKDLSMKGPFNQFNS